VSWPQIGDEIQLVCPITCEEYNVLTKGTVVEVFSGEEVFAVRFPGGRIVIVTRVEFTPH
jgi:hypothetical protein